MKIIGLILVCLSFLHANLMLKLDKDTVLMVNGVKITKVELDRGVKALFPMRYYHGTISDEKMKEFEKTVLDELLEKELIFQHAKTIGMKISKDDIEVRINKIKKKINDKKKFNDILKKAGFTLETLKSNIYKEELLLKFNKEKIEALITEEDLVDYYNKNKHKFKEPEKIVAKIIYVKNDPTDPNGKTKAKKRIEEAHEKIQNGEIFSDIAAKYSTAMSRIKGGDIGYVHRGMLDAAVDKIAFSMDSNTTSEIIESTVGFYIIKVEDKIKSNQLPYEKIKKSLKKELIEKTEKERKNALLKKLKSTAVIVKQP